MDLNAATALAQRLAEGLSLSESELDTVAAPVAVPVPSAAALTTDKSPSLKGINSKHSDHSRTVGALSIDQHQINEQLKKKDLQLQFSQEDADFTNHFENENANHQLLSSRVLKVATIPLLNPRLTLSRFPLFFFIIHFILHLLNNSLIIHYF